MNKLSQWRRIAVCLILLMAPPSVFAGVRYTVSATSETTTIVRPHPTQLGDPEITRRPPAQTRRSTQQAMSATARVAIEGNSIRVDEYRLDTGRGKERPASAFLSRDGGATFDEIVTAGMLRRWPLRFSLDPLTMTVNAFFTMGGKVDATNARVERRGKAATESLDGRPAQRHRLRAHFDVPADRRFRRDLMKVVADLEVWTIEGVPASVPPGLQAWTTGFGTVDAALSETAKELGGFPVKSVVRLEMRSGRNDQTITSTLTVSGIEVGPIDASVFAPPEAPRQ